MEKSSKEYQVKEARGMNEKDKINEKTMYLSLCKTEWNKSELLGMHDSENEAKNKLSEHLLNSFYRFGYIIKIEWMHKYYGGLKNGDELRLLKMDIV